MQFAGETLPKIRSHGIGLLFLAFIFQMPLINCVLSEEDRRTPGLAAMNDSVITAGWVSFWAAVQAPFCSI